MDLPVKSNTPVAGWGNYPVRPSDLIRPERYAQFTELSPLPLARGLGRSYGDAALHSGQRILLMERLNRMLSFDQKTGVLRAESGVTLHDILQVFVPRGWFLPVTPGTQFVTLGGCVACDVHGKNHHVDGSFGAHVKELELILPSGPVLRCSSKKDSNIFWATVGGMGLTGVITEVVLQLIPIESAYMVVRHHSTENLEETLNTLQDREVDEQYSVAWIDGLARGEGFGRGVVMTAHHAVPGEISWNESDYLKPPKRKAYSLPFSFPSWVLNPWTIQTFNAFYYWWQSGKSTPFLQDYDTFFYPLDAICHWNRMYGKRGFVQYQFVVPEEGAKEALTELLLELVNSRRSSFLAILKRFGPEGKGMLSFPYAGYTLALDLPVSNGLLPFLDQLDQRVLHYGGRVYLAKDARMSGETFRKMYSRFREWKKVKEQIDPEGIIHSDLSRRLNI